MIHKSTLTVMGLYNWDPTIFDGMAVPGTDALRANIKYGILMECSDLEIAIPNADTFKFMLAYWSNSRIESWVKMTNALNKSYDPLHNYDRTETHTEKVTTDRDEKWNDNEKRTQTQTAGGSDNTTNRTAAFNGDSLAVSDDSTIKYGGTANTSDNGTQTGTQNIDEAVNRELNTHISGNIGVTTSQQMLESEIQLRSTYDIVSIIVNEFKNKFCLQVY